MNHLTGKIRLSQPLYNLSVITHISNTSIVKEETLTGYAALIPYKKKQKENVLLTLEVILNPGTVKSFLQKEPNAEFSIFICEVIGQALYKESSIILTHVQTEDEEFTIFVLINEFLNLQWFTALDEKKFNTYLKELRRFNGEKIPTHLEEFSNN